MINTNYSQNLQLQPKTPKSTKVCAQPLKSMHGSDTVSFKGHTGIEKTAVKGIKQLVHETAFFRDIQTKEFVKDYIEKNFAHKDKIKIIVGACSSGEEAITYSMLLDALKNKVKILGFDLGEQAIEQAKSKKFLMQRRTDSTAQNPMLANLFAAYKDDFIAFETKEALTQEQKHLKQLFSEFFEIPIEAVQLEQHSVSLTTKINQWIMGKIFKTNFNAPQIEQKIVQLKDNKAANCEFVQGDIMKLGAVTKGEKADVITFSNAMYHLISEDIAIGMRRPKKNAEEITRKIAQNVKENLNPNGIFVIGEDELLQTLETTEMIPKVFKEFGFKALNATDDHAANVWQLV